VTDEEGGSLQPRDGIDVSKQRTLVLRAPGVALPPDQPSTVVRLRARDNRYVASVPVVIGKAAARVAWR
jgi:hypothetical protein